MNYYSNMPFLFKLFFISALSVFVLNQICRERGAPCVSLIKENCAPGLVIITHQLIICQ